MVVENYMKDFKESIYHGAVISALAVGFTMHGQQNDGSSSIPKPDVKFP